eukprot:gene1656-biopygen14485
MLSTGPTVQDLEPLRPHWLYKNPLHVHYYGNYKLHMQSRNILAYYFQDEPINNTLAARFFLLFSNVQQALMDSQHIPFAAIHSRDRIVAEVLQPYLTALTNSEVHRTLRLDTPLRAFYVTLLMRMVTHAHNMESYSYETNSDNSLYLGDVNLLHRIQKNTSATKPDASIVHLDPSNPASTPASLLPGRLQGRLTSCLSHMDPNYLQEGGINNSMPDGEVAPNADRGALHPNRGLFIGHHRDGTEAQRKEMAAMLNKMTPAVARTMEDLREGYKGIAPPMHIEKDNDKQAFTSPYRKPPIEKLAQDKVCAELLLLGFKEPAPSAQHAANPVVALKKGPDGQYTANRVCYSYKAINLLTKDMHTGFPIAEELFQDLGDSKWFTQKVMETELGKRGLLKFSKVFIDDILVHSATFAEHIKDVAAVLQCLIDIGLRIHPDKSCFALDAVDFLGFDVSNHGLTPQAAKVQAIKDLPYPNNLKDLKTILGSESAGACHICVVGPGAQHGNVDALSRFPSPSAEDNTGARIDLDSDLYAAFPTVPTTPYVPLDLTLGHIVDYTLDVRSVLSICTTPLPAAVTYMAQNGITLYEMCGGMCAGLEAALRNGIQVNRYIYSDIAPAAQTVARYRTQALTNLYPHLLKSYACDHAFTTLPQNVTKITPEQLMAAAVSDQSQWLIIAGPECQDFSPAGSNRGLKGPRAAILQACTTVIGYIRQLQHPRRPLYIVENAAMQHNFRSKHIATQDFNAVNITLGLPICVDAATFDSGAHRLCKKWQNLVDPLDLQLQLNKTRRTANISANAFLDPGRSTTRVYRSDTAPFCLANNKIGQERNVLPTLVAYPLSRAFRPDKPGSIYSLQSGAWSAPNPYERERMLGYYTGATAAPSLTQNQRHILTGNSMHGSESLGSNHQKDLGNGNPYTSMPMTSMLEFQPPPRPALLPSPSPVLLMTTSPSYPSNYGGRLSDPTPPTRQFYGTERACLLAVTRSKAVKPHIWPSQPPAPATSHQPSATSPQQPAPSNQPSATSPQPLQHVPPSPLLPSSATSPQLAPGRQLDTDLRLAAMSKDTDGLNVHSDQFVLEYLRRGVLGSNWTTSRTRRTARGNTMLMHAVEYFSAALVVVPIPAKEAIHTVYAHSHGVLAHFGAYALCIFDNGPEFHGKFKEHLLHNFIDHRFIHPNHPQGNGFVERSVGTIKAALAKICSENLATDTWDIDIAKVVTAYNCSPQETTKCAPFTLLYARAPVMNNPEAQLAMTAQLPDLTDSTQVGDFVYIRRPNVRNSLQMAAQGMILRIIDLKPTEVVVLQGLPVEDWFCPNCKASGITAIPAGRTPEAPQQEPNLFSTPQTRSRDRAALACDKMLVIKQVRVQGGLNKAVWGTASFQGPLSRPWHPTHAILASEDNPSCEVYHT